MVPPLSVYMISVEIFKSNQKPDILFVIQDIVINYFEFECFDRRLLL